MHARMENRARNIRNSLDLRSFPKLSSPSAANSLPIDLERMFPRRILEAVSERLKIMGSSWRTKLEEIPVRSYSSKGILDRVLIGRSS